MAWSTSRGGATPEWQDDMKKLKYDGTAPGQADSILVDGAAYYRGHTYRVTDNQAAKLTQKGGFSTVKDKPKQAAPRAIAATIEE